jgi:hypothetical protein
MNDEILKMKIKNAVKEAFNAVDQSEKQRYLNGIREGEMILKSGKTAAGRKMSADELDAVKRSIESSKKKIEALTANTTAKNDYEFGSDGMLKDKNGKDFFVDNSSTAELIQRKYKQQGINLKIIIDHHSWYFKKV